MRVSWLASKPRGLPLLTCAGPINTHHHIRFLTRFWGSHSGTVCALQTQPLPRQTLMDRPHPVTWRDTWNTDTDLSSDERCLLLPNCLDLGESLAFELTLQSLPAWFSSPSAFRGKYTICSCRGQVLGLGSSDESQTHTSCTPM